MLYGLACKSEDKDIPHTATYGLDWPIYSYLSYKLFLPAKVSKLSVL